MHVRVDSCAQRRSDARPIAHVLRCLRDASRSGLQRKMFRLRGKCRKEEEFRASPANFAGMVSIAPAARGGSAVLDVANCGIMNYQKAPGDIASLGESHDRRGG